MNISLTLRTEFKDHPDAIREIGVHREGAWFFARSEDILALYDLKAGKKLRGFYDSSGYSAAAWGADGRTLLYMTGDTVHFFDLGVWQDRLVVPGELKEFRDNDVHLGEGMHAVSDQGGAIKIYRLGADEDEAPEFVLDGQAPYVEYLAFHPSGKLLASAMGDRMIQFWDLASRSVVSSIKVHDDSVTSLAFSPDGSVLISGDYVGRLRIWDFKIA
jgi:WD40 repeat protein